MKLSLTFGHVALDRLDPGHDLRQVGEVGARARAGLKDKRWAMKPRRHPSPASVCPRVGPAHVGDFAVVVVCGAVVLQHVLDDVASGPAGEHHFAVLIAHVLRPQRTRTKHRT